MADRPPDDPTGRRQPPRRDDPGTNGSPTERTAPVRRAPQPTAAPPSEATVVQRYAPSYPAPPSGERAPRRTTDPSAEELPRRPKGRSEGPGPSTSSGEPPPISAETARGDGRAGSSRRESGSSQPSPGTAGGGLQRDAPRQPFRGHSASPFGETTGAQPPAAGSRPAPDPLDPDAWADDLDEWLASSPEEAGWTDGDTAKATPRPSRLRRTATKPHRPRPSRREFRFPTGLASTEFFSDRIAVGLVALNVVSLLLLAIALATTSGSMTAVLVQHLDAAGLPDRWGSPRILWRIPLLAAGITAMNTALAWFLAPTDRFASRFTLASALVVQLVAWIALFDYL